MALLNIINFGLNLMMVWSFVFILYVLWLIKRKVERTDIFNKIYTWLLFSIVNVIAYGLLASIFSILALELTDNVVRMALYLPWILFSLCIYKVGKTLWDLTKKYGFIETEEQEKSILESERRKIKSTLNLLQREFKEGMISKKSYDELRVRNEIKLLDAEKKLRGWKKT